MSLETTFNASLNLITHLLDNEVISQPADMQELDLSIYYKHGTGAGHISNAYSAQLTIPALSTLKATTLNFNNCSLLNSLNQAISFTILKVLAIQNIGTGNIYLNGAAGTIPITNGITDSIIIPAGGFFIISNGMTDTAGFAVTSSNSNITLTADNATTVNILALGE